MCRRTEEVVPTVGLQRYRHLEEFFNVPLQARTWGHPFYCYSEKPPHFSPLLWRAIWIRRTYSRLNHPGFPMGVFLLWSDWVNQSSIKFTTVIKTYRLRIFSDRYNFWIHLKPWRYLPYDQRVPICNHKVLYNVIMLSLNCEIVHSHIILKMIRNFPRFARLWLAETVFPRMYLRVSTPQTAFRGLFRRVRWPQIRALSILANGMVGYCKEFAMSID